MKFPSSSNLVFAIIISGLSFSSMTGCSKKEEAAAIATPAEAQNALQEAFKSASPEAKAAADQLAAEIQNQPAKALGQLQALSASPDLDPKQRNVTQDSIVVLAAKLREAAAQGDAEAEKALQAYRASK